MRLVVAVLTAVSVASASVAAVPTGSGTVQAPATAAIATPSAERLELARQYIASTRVADTMITMMRVSYRQAAASAISDDDSDGRDAAGYRVERLLTRLEPYVHQAVPELIEQYAQAYAREFSADELRQLVAFAASPVGKHYIAQAAALETDPRVLAAQGKLWQQLATVMEDFKREICAERAAVRVAAGDTKAKCPLAAGPETLGS